MEFWNKEEKNCDCKLLVIGILEFGDELAKTIWNNEGKK